MDAAADRLLATQGRYPAAGRELGAQDALPVWGALPSPAAVSEAGRGVPRRSSLSGVRGVGRRGSESFFPIFSGEWWFKGELAIRPAAGSEWNSVLGRIVLRISPPFVGADTSVACLFVFNPSGDESELGIFPLALGSSSRD